MSEELKITYVKEKENNVKLKVIGVGGCGGNAINRMINVGVKGVKPKDLAKTLLDKHKIFTVAIDGVGVHGCRITPNVYTSTKELDVLVDAIKSMR